MTRREMLDTGPTISPRREPRMPATQAKALVRELVVLDADPTADRQALERLALWVLRRYAPIASADPPDGLIIDTTGAEHLHGGEETMLGEMVERLAASGIAALAAVADSWGTAHAVARWLAQGQRQLKGRVDLSHAVAALVRAHEDL